MSKCTQRSQERGFDRAEIAKSEVALVQLTVGAALLDNSLDRNFQFFSASSRNGPAHRLDAICKVQHGEFACLWPWS